MMPVTTRSQSLLHLYEYSRLTSKLSKQQSQNGSNVLEKLQNSGGWPAREATAASKHWDDECQAWPCGPQVLSV